MNRQFFSDIIKPKNNGAGPGSIAEISEILDNSIVITTLETTEDQVQTEPYQSPVLGDVPEDITWTPEPMKTPKTTVVPCIVIDRNNRWHQKASVDIQGIDTSKCTWNYYGKTLPVFVEKPDGGLMPFVLPDVAGESCNKLYKGANPSSFKAAFKYRNNLMQKLQIGLMVALVLGLFFMMFLFIDWKG